VAQWHEDRACRLLAERWRCDAGEIDLIVKDGPVFVFVEVKTSRTHASASAQVGPRQIARIAKAAEEYCARHASGSLTEMRFEVALVDANGAVKVLTDAFADI